MLLQARPEPRLQHLLPIRSCAQHNDEGPAERPRSTSQTRREREQVSTATREMAGGVAERVMVGRDREQAAVVRLSEAKCKPRIKLFVDATGLPKIFAWIGKRIGAEVIELADDNSA